MSGLDGKQTISYCILRVGCRRNGQVLSNFGKGQIEMARRLDESISKASLSISKVSTYQQSSYRRDKPQTGSRVLAAEGSSMREGNKTSSHLIPNRQKVY